jgi:predicted  nucleic acid-binding Zn-ribbon protein
MTDAAIREKIEALTQVVARLQQRIEDLEDLRDLEAAIAENAGKPLASWEAVKADLDLKFTPEFEKTIQQAERDMAEGKTARVREPGGS